MVFTTSLAGRATIIDIARIAGVSKSTVSLVLKNSALVKAETRAKVEAAMGEVGYVYNRAAANLRTSKSNFVGMVISDLNNAFFSELATGIEDAFYKAGYVPILANTNEDPVREARVLQSMREQGVAGVIISPTGTNSAALEDFRRSHIPLVTIARRIQSPHLTYIGQDNVNGVEKACAYLIKLGHRRIGFLSGPTQTETGLERRQGYIQALAAAGIAFDPKLIIKSPPTRRGGAEAAEELLRLDKQVTAAVCFNDIIAFGAMTTLAAHKLEVGRDFSVIGFDNIGESEFYKPPLTTINAHTRALGEQGGQILLELIEDPRGPARTLIGPVELVLRQSCGPPPALQPR